MSPRDANARIPPMSGSGPKRPATYEDLLDVPDSLVAEIVDGGARDQFPARHSTRGCVSRFRARCIQCSMPRWRNPGGWVILFEPELHIVGRDPRPRHRRLASGTHAHPPRCGVHRDFADWVCEVLSPATAALDRTRKMRHYARAGVSHLWLLDPQPETLEVFRLDGDSWRLVTSVAGAVQIAAKPFDAIEMNLARIWAR